MARNGKIARLPNSIREQVNTRLHDGEASSEIAQWLNSLPEVEDVLKESFDDHKVTEQNISQWRTGGYREWKNDQRILEAIKELSDLAENTEKPKDPDLAGWITKCITAKLADLTNTLLRSETSAADWVQQMKEITGMLATLSKISVQERSLRIERARFELAVKRHIYATIPESDRPDFGRGEGGLSDEVLAEIERAAKLL